MPNTIDYKSAIQQNTILRYAFGLSQIVEYLRGRLATEAPGWETRIRNWKPEGNSK
jgi:hypothetical protein